MIESPLHTTAGFRNESVQFQASLAQSAHRTRFLQDATPRRLLLTCVGCVALLISARAWSDDKFLPGDPYASIDGAPVYLGEVNLVLMQRLRADDLEQVPMEVQQATAALLIRQHKALKSLLQQGGTKIESIIAAELGTFRRNLKRQGSSLADYAKKLKCNEEGVRQHLKWQIAWREYLKSRMTDRNLKIYYEKNRDKYAGGQWDISQIVLTIDPRDSESVGIAQQRLEGMLDQLKDAADLPSAFAAAARENSDGGSAEEGGRLGWTRDGDVPKSVMDAVRQLAPGQVSKILNSPRARHLVLLHEFKPSDLPFEKLADQAPLRRDAANALFDALVARQSDAKVQWYIRALKPPMLASP